MMLPPPITTPTMEDLNLKSNEQTIATKQQQHHNQTALYLEQTENATTTTTTSSADTVNTNRIKTFFSKTLLNLTKTNLTQYPTQYASSASTAILPPKNSRPASANIVSAGEVYDDVLGYEGGSVVGNLTDGFASYATAAAAADMAVSSLSSTTHHLETTTTAFPTAQTVATFIAGNKNRATTIIVYPTVSPESIVIPIVSCIFGFPILAFIVICCLRHRAKLARERDRRRNYDMQDHAVSLVRFSPIHRLNYRSSRAISLRPERSLSRGFTSLELDTVVEERCSDVEQTQTEILHPESPMETSSTSYKMSLSSS